MGVGRGVVAEEGGDVYCVGGEEAEVKGVEVEGCYEGEVCVSLRGLFLVGV